MDLSILLAAGFAGFVYGITPGPGVLAVLGIGADQGRRAGAAFLLGHLVGDILWLSLAMVAIVGVTAIGSLVFDVLGIVSGLYLMWLGFVAVRARRSRDGAINARVKRPLMHGLVFGLTNPKAYPVAVATLTAILSAKAGLLAWGTLPALVVASSFGGFLAYAVLVGFVGVSAVRRNYRKHEVLISRISGIMFIGFAANALYHAAPGLISARRA
jgi:threonine/homoserine/homoserine lactone efflux protein